MPPEDHKNMKKIQCWIPLATWQQIESKGYTSPTIAVTKAFELLLRDSHGSPKNPLKSQYSLLDPHEIPYGSTQIPKISQEIPELKAITEEQKAKIEDYKTQVRALNTEIERLKNVVMEAPEPIELAKLQERNEGLNLLISEKEKRIEDLTKYKEDIGAFANYFKSDKTKMLEAPASAEKKRPWYKFW